MTSATERGFTLIELIVFIVVVSAGLAGILSVMNTTVQFSAEPMARKQAMVLAESILEEVVQKDYADKDFKQFKGILRVPFESDVCIIDGVIIDGVIKDDESDCDDVDDYIMDDVDDYSGKTELIFTDWPARLSDYKVAIMVVGADWSVVSNLPVPVKKITVTVSSRDHTIALSGYRADY